MAKEKVTSREEALKRIISQKEYDRIVEINEEWEDKKRGEEYRKLYIDYYMKNLNGEKP